VQTPALTQTPFWQVPFGQAVPSFTGMHAPLLQLWQVPQSVLVQQALDAMQTPLHNFCPVRQPATQVPFWHVCPVVQSAFVQQAVTAMQTPLQYFWPAGQFARQVPLTHVWLE
jgi:hypothetical protein